MLTSALLLSIYPFLTIFAAMALCSALLDMALGTVQPMVMSTLHQIMAEHCQGDAIAMRWMAVNLSSVTMPVVFSFAGSIIGVNAVFWMMGSCRRRLSPSLSASEAFAGTRLRCRGARSLRSTQGLGAVIADGAYDQFLRK